jgi:hypothetical protein
MREQLWRRGSRDSPVRHGALWTALRRCRTVKPKFYATTMTSIWFGDQPVQERDHSTDRRDEPRDRCSHHGGRHNGDRRLPDPLSTGHS